MSSPRTTDLAPAAVRPTSALAARPPATSDGQEGALGPRAEADVGAAAASAAAVDAMGPPSDAALRALLARARADGDGAVHGLVRDYVALRQALREVLAFVAAREGGAAVAGVPALRRARALAHAGLPASVGAEPAGEGA